MVSTTLTPIGTMSCGNDNMKRIAARAASLNIAKPWPHRSDLPPGATGQANAPALLTPAHRPTTDRLPVAHLRSSPDPSAGRTTRTIAEWGSLGELLGSVGVLVTLIFLVAQRDRIRCAQRCQSGVGPLRIYNDGPGVLPYVT